MKVTVVIQQIKPVKIMKAVKTCFRVLLKKG